jgi:hypothetical protein
VIDSQTPNDIDMEDDNIVDAKVSLLLSLASESGSLFLHIVYAYFSFSFNRWINRCMQKP